MDWLRRFFCWSPKPDLLEEAFDTWEAYKRDTEDHGSLDRCIKCWRKLLKKTNRNLDDRNDRDQALQYLVDALLAKYQSNPQGKGRLRMLQKAAGLAPELYGETSKAAPDHVYGILVRLADAFYSAFQHSGKDAADGHLLDSSIEWYRNANTLDFKPRTPSPGKVGLCKALLLKDPSRGEVVQEALIALQEAGNPEPTENRSYFSDIVGLLVQVYKILPDGHPNHVEIVNRLVHVHDISRDAEALDKAIELLEKLSTSTSEPNPASGNQVAELWASHGRLLLTRAARTPGDPVSATNDLREATRSSERAIQLAEAGPGRVFVHAQTTMALVISHRLSACATEISIDEVDEMMGKLTSTLAFDELSQSPEVLGAVANTIHHRRQRLDKEPPDDIVASAAARCTKAVENCQSEAAKAIIFHSRFLLQRNRDDLERAMRCYGQAATDLDVSQEEKQSREDKAKVLGECLKALVEPESPVVLVTIPFVEVPKCVRNAVVLLESFP